jgi:hypothetical protein
MKEATLREKSPQEGVMRFAFEVLRDLQTLHRDGLIEAEMVCAIHHSKSTFADDRIDSIFVVDDVAYPTEGVFARGHDERQPDST